MNVTLYLPFTSLESREGKKSIQKASIRGVRAESHPGSSKEETGIQEDMMVSSVSTCLAIVPKYLFARTYQDIAVKVIF